jgi:catechol 2,3-dioxygenase-like lactoylglutathione lyase family enzyme
MVTTEQTSFVQAIPALAVSNVPRVVAFFADVLGFNSVLVQDDYGIAALYEHCQTRQVVHPNGELSTQPWGMREFTILDPDRNAVTLFEGI